MQGLDRYKSWELLRSLHIDQPDRNQAEEKRVKKSRDAASYNSDALELTSAVGDFQMPIEVTFVEKQALLHLKNPYYKTMVAT